MIQLPALEKRELHDDFGINVDLMPASEATNAYDLIEDIKKAWRHEYRRVDMRDWWDYATDRPEDKRPECGFVACGAGWTVFLAKPKYFIEHFVLRTKFNGVLDEALEILSGWTPAISELAYDEERYEDSHAWPEEWKQRHRLRVDLSVLFNTADIRSDPYSSGPNTYEYKYLEPGTPAYGEAVIAKMEAIQREYADILKNTPIERER